MTDWIDYDIYRAGARHTVRGTVCVLRQLYSSQLDNARDILVYLPPTYHVGAARYPVIYMHDGQNAFDEATSFAGEWYADETLEQLSGEGIEAILVAVPNLDGSITGSRLHEYSPFPNARHGVAGRGDAYLGFLCDTLKPLIDGHFRTRPGRADTGLLGSSLGGLISLYGYFRRCNVFGFAGVLSPALYFADDDTIFDFVAAQPFRAGRLYLDVGTREFPGDPDPAGTLTSKSGRYVLDARRLYDVLAAKGYAPDRDLLYREDEGAGHHEVAWARRLPDALRFLLAGRVPSG